MKIIKSLLIPPETPENYIERSLINKLQENKNKRLFYLKAAEGFGKTSLMLDYYHRLKEKPLFWLRVPPGIFSLKRLVLHLIFAVQNSLLDGKTASAEISPLLSTADLEELLIELSNLITEQFRGKAYFFLDNFQNLIMNNDEVDIINNMFSCFPADTRFIISSEKKFPFSISTLIKNDRLFSIEERELKLSFEETVAYLSKPFPEAELKHINEIHEITNGQFSILSILSKSLEGNELQKKTESIKNIKQIIQKDKNLNSYLNNLLNKLPDRLISFLQESSLMNLLDVEECNSYLGITNSRQLLEELLELNLVLKTGKNTYLHRKNLQELLKMRFNSSELDTKYSKLASFYLERDNYENGVIFLLRAGRETEALKLISTHIEDRLNDLSLIQNWLKEIPEEKFNISAKLSGYHGKICEGLNQFKPALKYYQKALKLYQDKNRQKEILKTGIQIAGIYWHQEKYQQAIDNCLELLPLINKNDYYLLSTVYNLLGLSMIEINQLKKGNDILKKALSYCRQAGDKNKEGWILSNLSFHIYNPAGNFEKAVKTYQKALDIFSEDGDLAGQVLITGNLSALYLQIGELEKADEFLKKTGDLLFELKKINSYPVYYILKARLEISRGRLNEAAKNLDILQKYKFNRKFYRAHLYLSFSHFYTARQDYERALFQVNKGINISSKNTAKIHLFEFLLQKVRILYLVKNYSKAAELLNEIIETARKHGCNYYLTEALFYKISLDKKLNQLDNSSLSKLIALINRHNYHFIFDKLSFLTTDNLNLLKAKFNEKDLGNISIDREEIKEKNKKGEVTTRSYRISLFTSFLITDGIKTIDPSSWKNKKALSLLKYLLLNSKKQLHQEQLLELFWSEKDISRGKQNLYVALYEIRNLLHREVIISKNKYYSFNRKYLYSLDTELFENYYNDACYYFQKGDYKSAEKNFEKARKIYGNGLLPADVYSEWCESKRLYFQQRHIDLLDKFLIIQRENGEFDKAIKLSEELLNLDPYREETNSGYLELLVQKGKLKKALTHYQELEELYSKELNVPLDIDIYGIINRVSEQQG